MVVKIRRKKNAKIKLSGRNRYNFFKINIKWYLLTKFNLTLKITKKITVIDYHKYFQLFYSNIGD